MRDRLLKLDDNGRRCHPDDAGQHATAGRAVAGRDASRLAPQSPLSSRGPTTLPIPDLGDRLHALRGLPELMSGRPSAVAVANPPAAGLVFGVGARPAVPMYWPVWEFVDDATELPVRPVSATVSPFSCGADGGRRPVFELPIHCAMRHFRQGIRSVRLPKQISKRICKAGPVPGGAAAYTPRGECL